MSVVSQGILRLVDLVTLPATYISVAVLLLGAADELPAAWIKPAAMTRSIAVLILLGLLFFRV